MKLLLEVITPTKVILKEEADEIILTTIEGEITILPNHIDLLTKLKPGEMIIKKQGKETSLAVTGGFLEISNNQVNILADYAIRAENIEVARAEDAKQKAEKAMKEKATEKDYRIAEAELQKSLLELKVVRRKKSLK